MTFCFTPSLSAPKEAFCSSWMPVFCMAFSTADRSFWEGFFQPVINLCRPESTISLTFICSMAGGVARSMLEREARISGVVLWMLI